MKKKILTAFLISLTIVISGCGGTTTLPPLPFKIPEYKEDVCEYPVLPLYATGAKTRATESTSKEDLIRLQDKRIRRLENVCWKYYTVNKATNEQYHPKASK